MTENRPNVLYDAGSELWIMQDDYYDRTAKIIIPKGFKCDLASVPRILWPIIAPFELSEAAPLVHDYLYRNAGLEVQTWSFPEYQDGKRYYPKKYADSLFRTIMLREKVPVWKATVAYYAVKWFAKGVWKKRLQANGK